MRKKDMKGVCNATFVGSWTCKTQINHFETQISPERYDAFAAGEKT